MSDGHTEHDEQYESHEPLFTSAVTGLVQLPLGMYMPASLHAAVQVRVLEEPLKYMSSPFWTEGGVFNAWSASGRGGWAVFV